MADAESEIRALIEGWARAVHSGDMETVLDRCGGRSAAECRTPGKQARSPGVGQRCDHGGA